MVSVAEIAKQQSALNSAMRQGLEAIDRDEIITFNSYTKYVLPLDGYVFWVKNGASICVKGSFHYAIEEQQNETETVALNRVIFTSEQEVQEFDAIAPTTIWIGTLGDASDIAGDPIPELYELTQFPVMFAFSGRKNYYKQAEIYHYIGTAILPAMSSQIINSAADLPTDPIVTNSLPIWLAQNSFAPVYPSFLVPNNVEPPYIVAHIDPEGTETIQQFPDYTAGFVTNPNPPPALIPGVPIPIGTDSSDAIGSFVIGGSSPGYTPLYQQPATQLMTDHVRLTLVGFNNQTAQQFYNSLLQYSLNTDMFGFQNSPAIRDEKRTQVEVSILQQRKRIDIVASYFQSAANVVAMRLITEATAALTNPT